MIRLFTRLWENFKEYIILILLILLSLVLLSQNQSSEIKKVRTLAFGTFAVATSVFNDIFSTGSIKDENEKLRKVNAELMLQISKYREYAITAEEFKNLAGFKDTAKIPLIEAVIVSKSLTSAQGVVTINSGYTDGVRAGMPVVNHLGLLGIVYSTSDNFSIVRTLQNSDLKLTVKCERTREHAVMRWNGDNLILVNIPKTYQIRKGDRIVTSELSSIVPVPIPVGVADDVGDVETGLFNEIGILPFVDFYKAEYVFVVGLVNSKQIGDLELNFYNRKF